MRKWIRAGAAVVGIAVAGPWVWGNVMADRDARAATRAAQAGDMGDGAGARLACRNAIEGRLHDPRAAEWGPGEAGYYGGWPTAIDRAAGTAIVRPAFRGRNAYGATVLSEWTCAARFAGGAWSVVDLAEAR